MSSDRKGFQGRVNYAAGAISSGKTTGRAFSDCFEWMDGEAVILALLRRAKRRPGTKMASRMPEVFVERSLREISEKYKDLPDDEIPALAQRMIDRANERWQQQHESEDTDG